MKVQFHPCEAVRLPADAWFSGESVPEGMAAAFTVKTACSDFIGEKDVKERVFAGCIGKMPSDAKSETRFVAAEIGYLDHEISVGCWNCGELVEFVLHVPIAVHLCAQKSVAYFPDSIVSDDIPCFRIFGIEIVVPDLGGCGEGAAEEYVEEYEDI